MDKYYITDKDTETGKKFQEIDRRSDIARDAIIKLSEKYGFKEWRYSRISHIGGLSSCVFETTPDLKIWKSSGYGHNEYMPRLNCKAGKEIHDEIKKLPIVHINELNNIVGYHSDFCNSHIGFKIGKNHFGFIVSSEWGCKIPNDCKEITASEYELIDTTL